MSTKGGKISAKMSDDNVPNSKSTNDPTSSTSNSNQVFESLQLDNLNMAQLLKSLVLEGRDANLRNQGKTEKDWIQAYLSLGVKEEKTLTSG